LFTSSQRESEREREREREERERELNTGAVKVLSANGVKFSTECKLTATMNDRQYSTAVSEVFAGTHHSTSLLTFYTYDDSSSGNHHMFTIYGRATL
jgi:hypothetical protein